MVALSYNAVILLTVLKQRHRKYLVQVLLGNILIVLPRIALVVFTIRFCEHLASPTIDLLPLLDETVMELRIDVDLAVVGSIVVEQLFFGLLLPVIWHAFVAFVKLLHFFEVLLTVCITGLHICSEHVALVDLLSLCEVSESLFHVVVPKIAGILRTPLYDAFELLFGVEVV